MFDLCIVVDSLCNARYHIDGIFCFSCGCLSLCFVKYELSLCVGLCATLILNGRSSLAVIADVLFMYGKVIAVFGCSGCSLDLLICRWLRTLVSTLLMKFFG